MAFPLSEDIWATMATASEDGEPPEEAGEPPEEARQQLLPRILNR